MPRTVKGKKRFPYRILLVPEEAKPPVPITKRARQGTALWKHRAIYNVKMLLTVQIKKASRRARWKWYQYYSVRGYGAPEITEFICPFSGMIAKTINQEEAASVRKYWVECAKKSREILEWIELLDPQLYTRELNHFILRLVFLKPNQREYEEYIAINPFQKPKPWRELSSTTSDTQQLDGRCSLQPRLTTESHFAKSHSARIAA
jgi:hypothetical protein